MGWGRCEGIQKEGGGKDLDPPPHVSDQERTQPKGNRAWRSFPSHGWVEDNGTKADRMEKERVSE